MKARRVLLGDRFRSTASCETFRPRRTGDVDGDGERGRANWDWVGGAIRGGLIVGFGNAIVVV